MSNCDVIVRAVAQMPDLSISRALLNMQQPKVRDGMVAMKICLSIRGEIVLVAIKSIRMSMLLISRLNLFHSSKGSMR